MLTWLEPWYERLKRAVTLPPTDLLRDRVYRRLWSSILISSLGGQITMLALPLTAAVLLQATPTQMGLLTSMEIVPFVLFSLPGGVWLDRVRKLPVYVAGETLLAFTVATVPLAAWMGWLSMGWLYAVGFVLGCVYTVAGSAAQIVLTQVVSRDRLVEAHAKNALASSGAEVAGPGVAGLLIKMLGAPMALAADALLVLASALILRGIRVEEQVAAKGSGADFWRDLKAGVNFVRRQRLLVSLACAVGGWQMFHNGAQVVQILFATRVLGLTAQQVGLSYVGLGAGTVLASVLGHRLSRRIGPGPSLVLGFATCGLGWLALAVAPANALGIAAFAFMLFTFGIGAVLIFINFLSLRQAVTPAPL
ncbi:MAG TPA: MFS transporter, partial [Burkholderiaceae bacterium]